MYFRLRWDYDPFELWMVRALFAAWTAIAAGALIWAMTSGDFAPFLGLIFGLAICALGGRALSLLYFLSLQESKVHLRKLYLNTTVAYKDVDNLAFDAEKGEVRITYRPYAGRGRMEGYKEDLAFRPRQSEVVMREIQRRVEAAKSAKEQTGRQSDPL